MMDEDDASNVSKQKSESPLPRRQAKKIVIPRRAPSVIIPRRQRVFTTLDKTTCVECNCFPKEDPYRKPKKLNPCQKSPATLYELAEAVVDNMRFPDALSWSVEEVAKWMGEDLGFPQYQECVTINRINGMGLLMLENPSKLPDINIHDFKDMQYISMKVRQLFGVEFVRFARSIGLPPRKPLTHCTWFKSRTGPSWGVRKTWNRCDILRWMKIIMPSPVYRDHWDMVWYHKPDFPKVMFARVPKPESEVHIPHYKTMKEVCREYLAPRKFRIQTGIPETEQTIWMEHCTSSLTIESSRRREKRKEEGKKQKLPPPKQCSLMPKKIDLSGLVGKDLILARRKMAKPKFLA